MSRPKIKNLSSGNWIIVVNSLIAIICYFFPWLTTLILGGVIVSSRSGLGMALAGRSDASGIPWQVFSAVLISAVLCLILCVAYIRQGLNTIKIVPIAQIFLSLIGLVPFVVLIFEFKHWTGVTVVLSYFFWITILAMIGILIGSVLSYVEIHRHSTSDKASLGNFKAGI